MKQAEIIVGTFVMGEDGHVPVKPGDKVSVSDAEASHLVAVGKAKLVEPSA